MRAFTGPPRCNRLRPRTTAYHAKEAAAVTCSGYGSTILSAAVSPEVVADCRCRIGESPTWHDGEQRLYWVDIPAGRLFRFDPTTGKHDIVYEGAPIAGMTVQLDGAMLLFMEQCAMSLWRDGQLKMVRPPDPKQAGFRFNDVIADPVGRVFGGTRSYRASLSRNCLDTVQVLKARLLWKFRQAGDRFGFEPPKGALYRLDGDATLTRLVGGIGGSNGLGFSPDRTKLYYTDSDAGHIYAFDYREDTGAIARQRVFATVPEKHGRPDGLAVDVAGFVWSARWDGGCIVRYAPDGSIACRIDFPARKVTSLAFGGKGNRDLYVTTAGGENRLAEGAGAGALFRIDVGIEGMPAFRSAIGR